MGDRAGSLIGVRANGTPLLIKCNDAHFISEKKFNRAVTTDAGQAERTIVCSYGGILKCKGFVDPANTANAWLLGSIAAPNNANEALTTVKYLIDISETAASRHGFDCASCTLIVNDVGGPPGDGGMQEIDFEIHSNAGCTYSSALT